VISVDTLLDALEITMILDGLKNPRPDTDIGMHAGVHILLGALSAPSGGSAGQKPRVEQQPPRPGEIARLEVGYGLL
jgi:hypothetical protein